MDLLEKKYINNDKISVPLGDKGIPGERNDMLSPQITDKYERYEHLQRYKYALRRCKGKILDLGCGTGYGTKMLSNEGNKVYGIDKHRIIKLQKIEKGNR